MARGEDDRACELNDQIGPSSGVILRKSLQSIQTLRGIAALMVMGFHLYPGFYAGSGGVDVFFVISGFIMGTVGIRERPAEFLKKRIARIVPVYWLVTGIMCLGGRLGLFSHFTFGVRTVLFSLFFVPYFNADGKMWPLLVPGWTLNYEMFFYLVFAAGLVLKRPFATTFVALVLGTALGVLLSPQSAVGLTWTSPLLLEFLAGMMLARLQTKLPGAMAGLVLLILGLAGFVFCTPIRHVLGGDYRVVTWGIPAFALVSGAVAVEYAGKLPGRLIWPMTKVGDCSYSLYLLQGLVIVIVHRFMGEGIASSLACCLAAIAVALCSFYFVEKPSAKVIRRLFGESRESRTPA